MFAVVITGFAGLLAWQNGFDFIWVLTGFAGAFLVAEFWVFHRSLIVSLIPIVLHLLFSTLYTSVIVASFSQYETPAGFILWTVISLHAIQLVVAAIYPYVARVLSQGKVWVNLVISFIIYNATLVTLTVSGTDLSFILAAGIAAVAGMAWLVLRAYFPLQRKTEVSQQEVVRGLPTTKHTTAFYNTLSRIADGQEEIYQGVRFYHIQNTWWAVAAVYAEDEVLMDEKGFRIDGEDHSAALPSLLTIVADFSQERKVKDTSIQACIVITPTHRLPRGVIAAKVASARNPDRNLGTVKVISADRLEQVMRRHVPGASVSDEGDDQGN